MHDFALTMASGALRRVLWCSMTGSCTRQTAPLPDLAARSALVAACIRSPYRRHRGGLGNADADGDGDTQADVGMKQRSVKGTQQLQGQGLHGAGIGQAQARTPNLPPKRCGAGSAAGAAQAVANLQQQRITVTVLIVDADKIVCVNQQGGAFYTGAQPLGDDVGELIRAAVRFRQSRGTARGTVPAGFCKTPDPLFRES